jgi:hypothetical protein
VKTRGRLFATSIALASVLGPLALSSPAFGETSPDGVWRDVDESSIRLRQERRIVPDRYRALALDETALGVLLALAPHERTSGAHDAPTVLTLPLPDGGFGRFQIEESPIMAPQLAARFPEIRTFAAQGLDEPTASARLDITPAGFHALVLSAGGTVYIDPYVPGDTEHYVVYFKRDYGAERTDDYVCHFGEDSSVPRPDIPDAEPSVSSGTDLRTYRLAVAATGEYTQFHGGTKAAGMAAIVTAMNRVNAIYERDVAIRMELVPNNVDVVYTNPNTDPYLNFSGSLMLSQNQTNLDEVIGSANYDIGHVFSTGGGGIAGLGVSCRNGQKARGVTGLPSPIGDPFYVDFVAHEMGHQWGANHTFNGSAGACNGNQNAETAYEPGSGSTIMAYAGICGDQNLQPNSDDHFHLVSLEEIVQYSTLGAGGSCAVETPTGNTPPVVDAGSSFTIPLETPFTLCGSASDANGDTLTLGWEEFDRCDPGMTCFGDPNAPTGDAPIFRSFSPTTDPCRTFPRVEDLVANGQTIGEILPTYARSLTFRLTARDNRVGGGGLHSDQVEIPVTDVAGPFLVLAPNTDVSWTGATSETVAWDVAGTDGAPIFCSEVDILFSDDGGMTFPVTVLAGTPNDGAESITVPNVDTNAGRLKVACSNNVFFDISNEDFVVDENDKPVVSITDPAEGEVFDTADTIAFTGSASDPEDGDRTAFLDWTSDLDGALGSGGSFSANLTTGYHTVSAAATDSAGQIGVSEVHVAVEDPPVCPAHLTVESDPPDGIASTYEAVVSVTVGSGVSVGETAEVRIRAGDHVRFDSNVAIAGAFVAEITPTPCS